MRYSLVILLLLSQITACAPGSGSGSSGDSNSAVGSSSIPGIGWEGGIPAGLDCTIIVPNGTYSTPIGANSFPQNSVVCAENDGQVIYTGAFQPSGYDMRGFVVFSDLEKNVSNGIFERMSFIGGPACGNNINTGAGNNTVIRDSAFYGLGGRYLLSAFQKTNVAISNAIFRVDGGWGETNPCNDFGPNAAMILYDTNNAICDGCINIDQNPTAASNSGNLGGLGINAHTTNLCYSIEIRNSVVYNGERFFADGSGRCNPVYNNNKGDLSIGLGGSTTVNDSTGSSCNTWVDPVIANNNNFVSGNCASAQTGVALNLDRSFLDDPRWRHEMCFGFSTRTDGWCANQMLLSDYISQ